MTVTKTTEWGDVRPGDVVRILNERANYRRGTFTFVAHCRNDDGSEWVDVFGGTRMHEKFCSIPVRQVVLPKFGRTPSGPRRLQRVGPGSRSAGTRATTCSGQDDAAASHRSGAASSQARRS